MLIPQSFISELISRCEIEDIISSYISIKHSGRTSKALCPFHSEKTPSFTIYNDTQSFYCFGCGVGGDVINFIMRAENLDYVEAIKFLATRVGMTVPDGVEDKQSELRSSILKINRMTAQFFHTCLKQPFAKPAYEYLQNRQLSDKIIVGYGLGFAPDSWDSLVNFLSKKGFSKKEMLAAKVVSENKNGGVYDIFRNRIIFPIIDLRGNVIAFGGRVLDDSKPKYLNSPDTLVFKKSRNLFSLNFAKNHIKDKLILAEGYMDVISIYSAGFKNVVATLGTSLTEEQARIMSKYTSNVVIAYDSDEAGQAATHRAINLLGDASITATILKMDGAKDPDEYIKKYGAKRFEILINGASDFIVHELDNLKQKCNINTIEGKIEYGKKAIFILADIKNNMQMETYAAQVARDCDNSKDTVITQIQQIKKARYKKNEKKEWRTIEQDLSAPNDRINPQKRDNKREAKAEEQIISFLFRHCENIKLASQLISPQQFVTDFNRRVYQAILNEQENDYVLTISTIAHNFSHEEIGAISAILANNDLANNLDSFKLCVNVLIDYGKKLKSADIVNVDVSELENYRKMLKEKKKK
ncbi:MAG: DNA primase [Oscillospiraceae bacterium]